MLMNTAEGKDRFFTENEELKKELAELRKESFEERQKLISLADIRAELIEEHKSQVAYYLRELEGIYSSLSWRLIKPIRAFGDCIMKLKRSTKIRLFPKQQLSKSNHDDAWSSTGDDPQFILQPENSIAAFSGWVELTYKFESVLPARQQIYYDLGFGKRENLSIQLAEISSGIQRVTLFIPHSCREIRLDPLDNKGLFKIGDAKIKKLKKQEIKDLGEYKNRSPFPFLKSLTQQESWKSNDHLIRSDAYSKFQWKSVGNDPFFEISPQIFNIHRGQYLVTIDISINEINSVPKIYFDNGSGYSEKNSIQLPCDKNGHSERILTFLENPRMLRFDPVELPTDFTINMLSFSPINHEEAKRKMLKKIYEKNQDNNPQNFNEFTKKISTEAENEGTEFFEYLTEYYHCCFDVLPGMVSYRYWIEKHENRGSEYEENVSLELASLSYSPCISILLPTFNSKEKFLRLCIESVLTQSYKHFELCIVDDASTKVNVLEIIKEYAKKDSRIKVAFREKNGHISAASNSALSLATGEYIALLDHDDELAKHALYHIIKVFNNFRNAQILYSDEDKIDENGKRSEPHFKPDWNRDLLYSQNYISHLGVYKASLIKDVGGFMEGVEGSQDYDLLLRCISRIEGHEIIHIPKILYHWRKHEGSTALAASEKSYTYESGAAALTSYFTGINQSVKITPGISANTYKASWPIPEISPLVSLIIPTRDGVEILSQCVTSILEETTYQNYEIIIVDNQSTDPDTLKYLKRINNNQNIRVINYDHPFNYSAINNFGAKYATGSILGLINNDIEVITPEWLTEMVSHAIRPDIGCVGAKLCYDNGHVQHAGVILGIGGVAGHSHKYFSCHEHGYFSRLNIVQNFSAVTGACLLVKKKIFDTVGGLDEQNLAVAFNDIDFCLRVREIGYRNLWTPYAILTHHESISRGTEDTVDKQKRFAAEIDYIKKRWGDTLCEDPYYNKNLTLMHENFSLHS